MRKPSYRKEVERRLRKYPILKVAVEDLKYQYPSCTSHYGEPMHGGQKEYISSTEKYAVQRAEKEMELKRIEQALKILNEDERQLVEERYFTRMRKNDEIVCDRIGWSKRSYYRVKKEAIDKVAYTLNLI
ncbi:ArpU family phage transcriptional regulator [Croceifilum oryzae]|uniref:ArpU family phage transcriptional regulator n=1 Tax=Croceifilum oryzae TaxID=1553429 RepID=A0AAJ1WTJ7_9BACL|nr:ArpU family phage packaging/lysis transcriptional regulator [Croceifilum oryzae]MDQ0418478.1 ArpU family phage transcriptional regulator [Croceifilum oryzae]